MDSLNPIRKFVQTSSGKLIIAILLIWALTMLWRYTLNDRPLNVITWDVYGYYVYLPAILIYQDVPSFSFVDEHRADYEISTNLYQLQEVAGEKRVPIYTSGLAWLWLPFFILAHFLALVGPWTADGLSPPYQMAILAAAFFYGAIGLVFLRKLLGYYFSDRIIFWTLAAVALGTNYFHYVAMDSGMPHAPLFALYALFLWAIVRAHRSPKGKWVIILSGLATLICLVRPSELILALLFGLYGIGDRKLMLAKLRLLTVPRWLFPAAVVAILLLVPQIVIWKMSTGQWIFNGYSGHHFDFLAPHILDGLFSYRKGWLVYTPVMVLALTGLFLSAKNVQAFRWAVPAFVVVNIYIVLSWHIWWYASSFGMRALVQSYAVLSLPLAALLGVAFSRKNWIGTLVKGVLVVAITLNLFQTWQYEKGILAKDEMNALFYWDAFGKTNADRSRYRLMDLDELYPGRESAERDLVRAWPDSPKVEEVCLAGEKQYSPAVDLPVDGSGWYRVEATVVNRGDQFDKYKVARLACSHIRDGKTLEWTGLRFPIYTPEGQWTTIDLDVNMEKAKPGDLLRVFLWNTSQDTACVRDIYIYRYTGLSKK